MGRSYKFGGEVNYSYSKKKKKVNTKDRVDVKNEDKSKRDLDDTSLYSDWEDDGDFEKFTRKK
tara:strand:+ start:129 stop:317 length:189 start_codon:yes stop_codon:yes gene_type:complete